MSTLTENLRKGLNLIKHLRHKAVIEAEVCFCDALVDAEKLEAELATDCIDVAKEQARELEDENKRLKWFVGMLRDVFNYNEYSKIDLNMILECLKKAENCEMLDKKTFQSIHMKILESGLTTLPVTEKALKESEE